MGLLPVQIDLQSLCTHLVPSKHRTITFAFRLGLSKQAVGGASWKPLRDKTGTGAEWLALRSDMQFEELRSLGNHTRKGERPQSQNDYQPKGQRQTDTKRHCHSVTSLCS